jgi:hypothetical protein
MPRQPVSRTEANAQLVQLAWALVLFYLSFRFIGPKAMLICLYGWSRTWADHLAVTSWGKTQPLVISNGDVIQGGSGLLYTFVFLCWLLVTLTTLALAHKRLSR